MKKTDSEVTYDAWLRYAYCRDNGHSKFAEKADLCERNFAGDQWDAQDLAKLKEVRRPALTINKIISTIGNVMGEQVYNRAETSFQPRSGAPAENADILTKVFKQISDNNQLSWKRSGLFDDGVIRSRGFLDVRLGFNDSAQGEVEITSLNSKNVVLDPDAEDYDPDGWGDVFVTKWVTPDDISILFSEEKGKLVEAKNGGSAFPYGYDSVDTHRDRFGEQQAPAYSGGTERHNVVRNVRLIERQYRVLDRQRHFLSPETGDMRAIPQDFDRNRIAFFVEKFGFQVTTKLVRRIMWLAMADDVLLHHDWSPYKHFTPVPYFPYFRYGRTIGLVENLLGSQELLNKTSSQELHIVNTTANSGYKVKAGALLNMTPAELEEKGAQTGIVIEVNGDPDKDVVKIQPNSVPSGLDRISYKAEEHIKTISGVPDSAMGMDRADVAAKAIKQKRQAASTNNVKPMDNLTRSDFILARNTLDLVQEFYTEHRVMTIVHDQATGETETFEINQPNPVPEGTEETESPYQAILHDLTLGEYGVVVTSVPSRETLEDSQFDQAVAMREMGVMLPDEVLVDSSRLVGKKEIIKKMGLNQNSPEAQAAAALQQRGQQAEVSKLEGEAAVKQADAGLRQAKTQETTVKTQVLANTPIAPPTQGAQPNPELEEAQAVHDADMKEREFQHKQRMDQLEHQRKIKETDDKAQLQRQEAVQKRIDARVKETKAAATAAAKPAPKSKV